MSLAFTYLLGGGRVYNNLGATIHTPGLRCSKRPLGLVGTTHQTWEVTTWLFLAQSLRQVRLNEILLDYSRDAALVIM